MSRVIVCKYYLFIFYVYDCFLILDDHEAADIWPLAL